LLALAVTALASALALLAPSARSANALPGFGQPTVSGVQGDGFEEGIRVDPTRHPERIYTDAPIGVGTSSVIWRSTDAGRTFKEVPSQIPPYGKPLACVGGGDGELDVDTGGHLYYADLWAGNFATGRSDDQGRTWQAVSGNCAGVPDLAVDRQWYASLGDPTHGGALFLVYDESPNTLTLANCPNNPPGGNVLQIARSPASGAIGATAGTQFSKPMALSCDEGIMGNDITFAYPDGPKVFVVHDNFDFDQIMVNRCDIVAPSATNPVGLTNCIQRTISDFPTARTGASFPTISVDDAGNLFAVWPQAPGKPGAIKGDTQLYFATSSDRGNTWSTPAVLPTPGLHQHVMPWPASGDPGRIDVAYYATPAKWQRGKVGLNGPDSINGEWSLYLSQTLDNGRTWSPPVEASEHFIHWSTMQTFIGGSTGNRGVGDFFQMRLGPQGEAEISYADTNNYEANALLSPQAMYVRQNSGPSLYSRVDTYDANGVIGPDNANLDLLGACMVKDGSDYVITLTVADLTSFGPDLHAGGTTNIWQTLWHVPSHTDHVNGGALFVAYLESVDGGTPTCWVGQSSQTTPPGGAEITYPGTRQLTGSACAYRNGAPGTITIRIPMAAVHEAGAVSSTLYSVTASTQTLQAGNAEEPPATNTPLGVIAGQLPNLIDVAPGFDMHPNVHPQLTGSSPGTGRSPHKGPLATTGGRALVPTIALMLFALLGATRVLSRHNWHDEPR
jgi:hypothetical protein